MKKSLISLLVVCLILLAHVAAAQGGRGDLRRNARSIPNQYIVVLAGADDPDAVGLETQTARGGRLQHVFRNVVRGFAMRLSPAAAAALSRDPRVLYVEEDGVVQASDTETSAPWGLDRIDQRSWPLNGTFNYPAPNTTVYVHVIDTGVRTTHFEFGGRATTVRDFVDDDGDGDPNDLANDDGDPSKLDGADCNGHGTHVASTIAGSTYGVAKSAWILSYRALDCGGSGTVSGVIAALDTVAADNRRPAVVNLSLAGSASSSLDGGVQRAINAGITVVVAAGNSNADASGFSPARVAAAITVGATDTGDVRAGFSNFGPVLDLFAPGVSITAAGLGSDSATADMSGTSMASPHVAGVAALYLSQVGNKTPAQVRDALVNAATPAVVAAGAGSTNLLVYSGFLSNIPPAVSITAPATGASGVAPATFTVTAAAGDPDGTVSQVAFYANASLIGTDTTAPYSVIWSAVTTGSYSVTAVATDNAGEMTTSASVTVTVTNPTGGGSAASFMGVDTSTRGNWKGTYGTQGSVLVADASALPPGASVVPTSAATWTWSPSTTDVRALQRTNVAGARLAATWYTSSAPFTVDITAGDALEHRLSLYAVDWDVQSRSQRLEILDPTTGAVLDSRTLTGFDGGTYVIWRFTGSVRLRVTVTAGVNAVVSGVFIDAVTTSNQRPSVALTAPASGASFNIPAIVSLTADASDPDGTVTQVAFYSDGLPIGTDTTAPYSVTWAGASAGTHALAAVATDNAGATTTSATVSITVAGSGGSSAASFIGIDASTRGNWKGTYGTQGSVLIDDVSTLPPGASVAPTNAATWTWSPSTTDVRALQRTNVAGDRLAATWYTSSAPFTVDITAGDALEHRLSLYAVDWDVRSRSQRLEILDPTTGAVLDSRTLTGFDGGTYVIWRFTGSVRLRVTVTAGVNAVVSGIFIDN